MQYGARAGLYFEETETEILSEYDSYGAAAEALFEQIKTVYPIVGPMRQILEDPEAFKKQIEGILRQYSDEIEAVQELFDKVVAPPGPLLTPPVRERTVESDDDDKG